MVIIFKTSMEAIKYGQVIKNDNDRIENLKVARQTYLDLIESLSGMKTLSDKDYNHIIDLAEQSELCKRAIETAQEN